MRVVDCTKEEVLDENGANGMIFVEAQRHHRHESQFPLSRRIGLLRRN
jgi:hypothetical protein